MYVCIYGRASPVPERLDGFYSHSVLNSLSMLGQCLKNLKVPTPKTGALQRAPEKKNCDFLKTSQINFYYISVIHGNHIPK
jgi:hypothetical protein